MFYSRIAFLFFSISMLPFAFRMLVRHVYLHDLYRISRFTSETQPENKTFEAFQWWDIVHMLDSIESAGYDMIWKARTMRDIKWKSGKRLFRSSQLVSSNMKFSLIYIQLEFPERVSEALGILQLYWYASSKEERSHFTRKRSRILVLIWKNETLFSWFQVYTLWSPRVD